MDNAVKPRLSVIIVSYNSLSYLKKCISSIRKYNDIGDFLEVIVVDNSSETNTIDWLKGQADIASVSNDNKGFGQGNNVGARIAKGDYLLFLNPDTELVEPIFRYAIQKFEGDPSLGLFGVQLINRDGAPNSTYGLRMPLGAWRTFWCNVFIRLKVFFPRFMYTSGADLFVRKAAFEEAGAFDERLFMYCEEADLCNRINNAGYKNAFYRDRKIIHLEGKTLETNLLNTYKRQMESRRYYCEKYGINYLKFVKKEIRFCTFKKTVFSMIGNKYRSEEYGKIVFFLKSSCKELTD